MGVVYGALILIMIVGPERLHHDVIMKDRLELEQAKLEMNAKTLKEGPIQPPRNILQGSEIV